MLLSATAVTSLVTGKHGRPALSLLFVPHVIRLPTAASPGGEEMATGDRDPGFLGTAWLISGWRAEAVGREAPSLWRSCCGHSPAGIPRTWRIQGSYWKLLQCFL